MPHAEIAIVDTGKKNRLIVADVGGTHIRVGSVDIESRLCIGTTSSFKTKELMDGEAMERLAEMVLQHQRENTLSVAALVVGLPATFDEDMDFLVRCNNVPGLAGRKLADELRARLGCPVLLEHDLMLHLLGETSLLDCSDSPTSLGVYFGTGIGGDVLLHDEPYRLYKTGFELGHIPYRTGGRLCVCGKRGCMEAYSNGHLLVALAEEHEIEIADIFCHWGTQGAIDETLRHIVDVEAQCIATAIMLFSPKYTIIGGGIVNMRQYPKKYLIDTIKSHLTDPFPLHSTEFMWASLGDVGTIIGGLRCYERRV